MPPNVISSNFLRSLLLCMSSINQILMQLKLTSCALLSLLSKCMHACLSLLFFPFFESHHPPSLKQVWHACSLSTIAGTYAGQYIMQVQVKVNLTENSKKWEMRMRRRAESERGGRK
jgi:hypothetical protein